MKKINGLFRNFPYLHVGRGWYNYRFDFEWDYGCPYIEIFCEGVVVDVIRVYDSATSTCTINSQKEFSALVRKYASNRKHIREVIEQYNEENGNG